MKTDKLLPHEQAVMDELERTLGPAFCKTANEDGLGSAVAFIDVLCRFAITNMMQYLTPNTREHFMDHLKKLCLQEAQESFGSIPTQEQAQLLESVDD